jgi:hypothetical protein
MPDGGALGWPSKLWINAWDGEPIGPAGFGANPLSWARESRLAAETPMFPTPPDLNDWRDPRTGWGLVLPARPGASKEAMASDEDAPEPIRQLRAARANRDGAAPIFRYEPDWPYNRTHLRNAVSGKPLYLGGSDTGVAGNQIPYYLVIYGTPEEIPWLLQYTLNANRAVGRLALEGDALSRYVQACLGHWSDEPAKVLQAVVWATSYDYMSRLMRDSIAAKVADRLLGDGDMAPGTLFLNAQPQGGPAQATGSRLAEALQTRRPALIVTTSHGRTGPLADRAQMGANLGLLIDQENTSLDPKILAGWKTGGAVWYAHACCSAGSDAQSQFDGLVEPGSVVDQTLKGVAGLGSRIAPLPQALLGAESPLRAFIGHVEPTFDWSLKQDTGQHLTGGIVKALTEGLYSWEPVGRALHRYYARLADLTTVYLQNKKALPGDPIAKAALTYTELSGRDIQSTVLLGDPCVRLATPPG